MVFSWCGSSLVWFILETLVISQYCVPYLYQITISTVRRQNLFKDVRMLQGPVGAQPCCRPSGPRSQHPPCLSQASAAPVLQPRLADTSHFIQYHPNHQRGTGEKFPLFPLSVSNAGAVLPKKPAGPSSTMLPTRCVTTRFLFILHEGKHLSAGFEASFCI